MLYQQPMNTGIIPYLRNKFEDLIRPFFSLTHANNFALESLLQCVIFLLLPVFFLLLYDL